MEFFFTIFYQPLYNLLVGFYDLFPSAGMGLAIILVTILIKVLLFPFTFKSLRGQKQMNELQPKIAKIREDYKDDKEKMAKELMSVYKDNNVNPFSSCLPLLIQLPIFFALYRVLRDGLGQINTEYLYSFVHAPESINSIFLGIVDLASISIPLAVLAAIAQYFQVKLTMVQKPVSEVKKSAGAMDENMMANMNKMMLYFMPAMTLMIGCTSMPGGVMLYWLSTTFITILLYRIFLNKPKEEEKK
ncbi:YidC/Oxa1 family membrane protein insertase [Patescibacteria group bacterium]|nr:YidC/Oxa1 family membrane protein insertase [Patescibacteria group bacterium]MBU4453397.1 YidC/Oxa1 family membrane protein insertase [Patescibacteria group bacterium]MCG2687631.1 YidC/Oxa1 family membrane protein insertase [Candidatus Parcubacteria bacterium]